MREVGNYRNLNAEHRAGLLGNLRSAQLFVIALGVVVCLPASGETQKPFSQSDREYWALVPPRARPVPAVRVSERMRQPVHAFIEARLEAEGIQPAPPADRATLIRRVYLDLIGLPPSPDEVQQFVNDSSPDAYEKLVDRLLASQHFGERWARHWLDLVRYADSDGYKKDAFRPLIWRYRDYVIRSFNSDKPFDQFVLEQLAGDELYPDDPEALAATGYLRLWAYECNQADIRTQWNHILNDVTENMGEVFLGLGLRCARCHNHKFDPILRRDFFRFRAFFAPLWPREDMTYSTLEQRAEYQEKKATWQEIASAVLEAIEKIEAPHRKQAEKKPIDRFPDYVIEIITNDHTDLTPLERQFLHLANVQLDERRGNYRSRIRGEKRKRWEALQEQLREFDKYKPGPLPPIMGVTDIGLEAPPTFIPGGSRPVPPGILSLLDPEPMAIEPPPGRQDTTGRRTALARWIASPDNPLTARVFVNRVWQQLFGLGIVPTPNDFGRQGESPSHPELLDWLARRFMENGWRPKPLIRILVTSVTYRRASTYDGDDRARKADPDNRLLWRMRVRRLDADQIRDAMLAVSGELDRTTGGPSVTEDKPRRSIYVRHLRNRPPELSAAFDGPDSFTSCAKRDVTTSPTQVLLLINGEWPLARARRWAERVSKEYSATEARIRQVFNTALGREPEPEERKLAQRYLTQWSESTERNTDSSGEQTRLKDMPHGDGTAIVLDPESGQGRLHLPDNPSLPSGDFTIEAMIYLESLYPDGAERTIAAHWDRNDKNKHPGWAFAVTSTKSKYNPRNLILQLVGTDEQGNRVYEVVVSNLRPKRNTPYYVAAVVRIQDTQPEGITFYMKDLSTDRPIETAEVAHRVTGGYRSNVDFTIGGRVRTHRHYWHGLIDEVRLSAVALSAEQLLSNDPEFRVNESTVGYWRFEGPDQVYADASSRGNTLRSESAASRTKRLPPDVQALADLCHVLLNSNAFLYVD